MSQIKQTNESEARTYLQDVLRRRHMKGKIQDVQVSIKPGARHYVVKVQYFGGPTRTTENPDIHQYGHSEHVEMLDILAKRQHKNKFEKGWEYILQNLIKFKENVEERLGFDQEDKQPISSVAKKRKIGEGPHS